MNTDNNPVEDGLLEKWKAAIKRAGFYPLLDCPFCGTDCGWFYKGNYLYYSSGCNCTSSPTSPRPSGDEDLLRHISYQSKQIKEFIAKYPETPEDDSPKRNIEVKYRLWGGESGKCPNVDLVVEKVEQIAQFDSELIQEDTFFEAKEGKLKLREEILYDRSERSELIYYNRPSGVGPKLSEYHRASVTDPKGIKTCLSLAYGTIGVVSKKRWLFMIGQTRVHIDHIENFGGGIGQMGYGLELEVVLRTEQTIEEGAKIAKDIITQLGIPEENELKESYLEIMRRENAAK